MDFRFTPEQQELIHLVRKIAREKVAPLAAQVDEREEIPQELFDTFRDAGIFGIAVPQEYGGAGMGTMGLLLAVEEVAKYCCATELLFLLTRLPLEAILYAGTEEQKRMYATGIAEGRPRGAFCLSEPDVGSDAVNIQTRAVRKGDRYVINGTKNWISGAAYADFFTVAVNTGLGAGHKGMSVFVVDRNTPG